MILGFSSPKQEESRVVQSVNVCFWPASATKICRSREVPWPVMSIGVASCESHMLLGTLSLKVAPFF